VATNRLGVRLDPAIEQKLAKYAAQRGIKTSTMATVIIGDWVVAQERQLAALKHSSASQAKAIQDTIQSLFGDEETFKMLMEMTPDVVMQEPQK
jgi:predicted transcriptional regulator